MISLVAGAGGFIGGHLVARLIEEGNHVIAVDSKRMSDWYQIHRDSEQLVLDLTDKRECEQAVRGVDNVYNLAADMGGIGFITFNKAQCMMSAQISINLLKASVAQGVEKYLYTSSACVYPDYRQKSPNLNALKESDAYPAMAEAGYGEEKLFGERLAQYVHEDWGLDVRIPRLHNVYGPKGAYKGGREKAPAAISRKVAEAKLTGHHHIEVWGDGHQTRSFMYVDDAVEGMCRLMASKYTEPINLGSSEMVTIDQLISITEVIAEVKLKRHYDVEQPQGVRGRNSDNTLIQQVLGWEPSIPLAQGMIETYNWVEQQVANEYLRR